MPSAPRQSAARDWSAMEPARSGVELISRHPIVSLGKCLWGTAGKWTDLLFFFFFFFYYPLSHPFLFLLMAIVVYFKLLMSYRSQNSEINFYSKFLNTRCAKWGLLSQVSEKLETALPISLFFPFEFYRLNRLFLDPYAKIPERSFPYPSDR